MSKIVVRVTLALAVTAMMATGLTAVSSGQSPAQAAAVCTWMQPNGPGTLINGGIRITDHGQIRWSMVGGEGCSVSFPAGGSLYVRALGLQTSGGSCFTNVIQTGSWWHYTGFQWANLASFGSGLCFRAQYTAGNWNSAYYTHRGRLDF